MKLPKYFYFRVKSINKGTGILLEDASDADVVEVVRCRDCEFGEVDDPDLNPYQYLCHHNGSDCNHALHFCSYGKRKKNHNRKEANADE